MRHSLIPLLLLAATVLADPKVANPSFEADRYGTWPGTARANGGKVTGWTVSGNVGINPVWEQGRPRHAFSDNARTPHGRQVAFIHNVGSLKQHVAGFETGKRYRVTYWENGRHNNAAKRNPRLKVTLGGQLIVSEHAVAPAEPVDSRALPYAYVESALFAAPADGACDLVFTTTFGDRVAVLIDQVQIVEAK